jgi:hypothetical protein
MADSRYLVNKQFVQADTKKKYIANTLYPDVPVSENDWYIITTAGDRLDVLAQQFYHIVDYWWIIAIANGLPADSLCPEIGIQIRIPVDPSGYLEMLEKENM